MAYKIKNTDGSTLLLLGDGKVDSESTSLSLVGKNYSSYGEIWNNNLIKLLGNFAAETEPDAPIKGQLWYDSFTQKLNVFDEEWEPLNGSRVEAIQPTNLSVGDFWFDSVNNQLYIKAESGVKIVGPSFPSTVGSNGWVLPANSVQDNTNGTSGNVKQVTLLRNYGTTLGYVANEKFTIATTSTNAYLTAATTSTVKGLTVFGDVRATENVYANTLTVTSSVVYPPSQRLSKVVDIDFYVEMDNLAFRVTNPSSNQWKIKVKAVTGTEDVLFAGSYHKVSGLANIHNPLTNAPVTLTTTETDVLPSGQVFDGYGDVATFILTKVPNIAVYKVIVQLFYTTGADDRVIIFIEKLS